MKVNKKQIGLIIGLVCVVIFVALMLRMCGGDPNEVIDETNQTEESVPQTEQTDDTQETTEPTEESTEPTEESTEETTEATLETTVSSQPSINNSVGSPGSVGTPSEEETTVPTEPEETVIIPAGQVSNPYAEVIQEYPAGFESVCVPGNSTVAYAVFVHDGAELTIENADAYVIHNGKTYESADGVVKLSLSAENGAPALLQLGNKALSEKAFTLSFKDALGEPTNPQILEKFDELTVELGEDDKTGYIFQWTAKEEGNVTFNVAQITENVKCDVILTVGSMTVHLAQSGQEGTEAEKTDVTIGISKDDVLTIQVITLVPEQEAGKPGEGENEPVAEKLPAAKITLKGSFTAGVNADKAEQEATKPTEPSNPTDPSTPTDPTNPTDPSDPSESTDPSTPTEPEDKGYSVTVTDYNGNPKTGVVVQFLKDGVPVTMMTVDSNGVASADLESGSYTVKLLFSGEELYYEEKNAVLTADQKHITLRLAAKISSEPKEAWFGTVYDVGVGGVYVQMQANVVNYFVFTPTVAGNYLFTTSDPDAVISFWNNTFTPADITASTDYANNAFTRNVKESNIGGDILIGVTGADDCILEITRIGDPILDETDFPLTVYEGTKDVTAFTLSETEGKTLTYVDLSSTSVNLVLNSTDGYYHLNSADGPTVYVNLDTSAPYISMRAMLGLVGSAGNSFNQHFYEDGVLVRREDYVPLMTEYVNARDSKYGVYPLTEDLKYMFQQGGDYKGWWDVENPNYLFEDVPNLNVDIAWMFACCYFS